MAVPLSALLAEFPGGMQIEIFRVPHEPSIGIWQHPGTHPSEETHIRWGRLDGGGWWVQHTNMPSLDLAFDTQEDAEAAVLTWLDKRRDGLWVLQLDPQSEQADPGDA